MTIDERLDRLTARHEALSQSLELSVSFYEKHVKALERSEKLHEKNQAMHAKNHVRIAGILESIHSLARAAHAPQNRTTSLEEGQN
jgi:hypothetical protein